MKIGLISYPRCGSNWTNYIIQTIMKIKSKGSTSDYIISLTDLEIFFLVNLLAIVLFELPNIYKLTTFLKIYF